MFNRTAACISAGLVGLAVSVICSCNGSQKPIVLRAEAHRVEPLYPCVSACREIDVDLEVVPGLILRRVSGLPGSRVDSPQLEVSFHWIATAQMEGLPPIDIFISASNHLGEVMVGMASIPLEQPAPQLWKPNVCFPVQCEVNLPVSHRPMEWRLHARVRREVGKAFTVPLGRVIVGS